MKCAHCNGEHPDGLKFCPVTGNEIIQSFKSCTNPECELYGRNELPFEARYCPKCGKIISSCMAQNKVCKVIDKTSYALGMSIGHNIKSSGVNSVNLEDFEAGVRVMFSGTEPVISVSKVAELLRNILPD